MAGKTHAFKYINFIIGQKKQNRFKMKPTLKKTSKNYQSEY